MTDQVAIALIGTIVPTITVVVSAWLQIRATRKGQTKTDQAVAEVHKVSNGRLDAALQSVETLKEQVRQLSAPPNRPPPSAKP